jgi:hypothetical protein
VGSHIGFYGATVTVTDENDLASSATTPIYPWRSGQRDWYFAEGTVRPGFVEYVVLAAESPATARLSFALSRDDGSVVAAPDLTMTVDTSVRVTINVNSTLEKAGVRGPVDVAIHVSADEPVAAERLMYFVSDPALGATVAGATDILGATDPATTTFFAEGTFRAGFEEFLTLLNPGSVDTTATVVLQLSAGSVDPVIVPLPRRSRRTIDVTRYLAAHGVDAPVDMSAEVTSAEPIVTERPIYFASVQGGSLIVGGTTATGTSDPSTQRLFAEGTVRPGFVEYLTLENPGTSNAHVRITYQATAPSGRVDVAPTDIVVGPARRSTVDVPDALAGTGAFDVAATVTSDVPVVAERVLYFSADPGLGTTTSGATSSPGTAAAGTEFLFAEGTLRPGWIEYLTIQNPNDGTIGFVVDFMGVDTPQVNGRNTCDPAPLQPRSRTTIDITALLRCRNLREPADVAFRLRASDNIVAERAVYFDSDPGLGHEVASGTDVVGSQR